MSPKRKRSLRPKRRQGVTIRSRWAKGRKILHRLGAYGGYGSRAKEAMAREKLFGINTPEDIRLHLRLATRWTRSRAERADKLGMAWREVIPLLSFAASSKEEKEPDADLSIKRVLTIREKRVCSFLDDYAAGLRGRCFVDSVESWKKEHCHLWPIGRRSRLLYDSGRGIRGRMSRAQEDIDFTLEFIRGLHMKLPQSRQEELASLSARYADLFKILGQFLEHLPEVGTKMNGHSGLE